ncbi:hypothetical protein [Lacipirellula parvula]|uniref:Uncharacterized protein n=1 Tax=Lacipirellula parvula TaxID=2650471 RepID=A0A5K7XK52_9BACT|nr:hypothetical protein [Lacipirellula parvula]BBO36542.1 hypothetical protein PLANPX_6154 [Lacipirellula parvula]
MLRKLHIAAIALVLFFLFSVPLTVFIYGFSIALGGLVLLTPLIILQALTLKAMLRRFPSVAATMSPEAEELNHETHEMNEKEKR